VDNKIEKLIAEKRNFVDTIVISKKVHPTAEVIRAVRMHAGSAFPRRGGEDWHRRYRFEVHQPESQALKLLHESFDLRRDRVCELHLAIDLITRTNSDAAKITRWFNERIVKLHRGKQELGWFEDVTRYSARSGVWAGRFVVSYCDKPDRFTDRPCAHFELRLKSSQTLIRAGIRKPSDVFDMDVRKLWKSSVALHELDVLKLGLAYRGRIKAKKIQREDMRCGVLFALQARGRYREPYRTTQAILDLARSLGIKRIHRNLFRRLDLDILVGRGDTSTIQLFLPYPRQSDT